MTPQWLSDLSDPQPDTTPDATTGWGRDGYIILPGLIPGDVIDAYCERFAEDAKARAEEGKHTAPVATERAQGYGIGTPYLTNAEMRDVCLHRNLTAALTGLQDETLGLHLNLTGWKSTRRGFHVDSYLSPTYVGTHYAATWVALDDVHPDAGPFEYVPGSHLWPHPTQSRTLHAMGEDGSDPDWPWRSEALLGPIYDREIVERGGTIEQFLGKKGDVLIWSSNLVHRGSVPNDPTLERRALISHYSELAHRKDMRGTERRWQSEHADGWYFKLGPVR